MRDLGGWKTLAMVEYYAGIPSEPLSQFAEQATQAG